MASLERRRLVFAAVALLSLLGLVAWLHMDRQEDPFFPYRYGQVLVSWPGADAEQIERLVLNPLQEEIAQVDEVNELRGVARLGFVQVIVGMQQQVYDTDAVWEQIRVAVDRAQRKFPDGAGPAEVLDRQMDTEGIVLAVTGSDDLLELLEAARKLRRELFRVPDIARIEVLADPGEQLVLGIDPAVSAAWGLDAASLGAQLAARNVTLPGGALSRDGRSFVMRPQSQFRNLEELADTPVQLPSGALLPLREVATIRLEPADPPTERMWLNGRPAVGLGIVIPENRLNAVRFGERVRALIDEVRPAYAPLEIREMFYQPRWVEERLSELARSLLLGVAVVVLVLLAFMGPRLGFTVAALLPMVTLSSIAIYAIGGGVLHQMAVAGLVIALGMLVDNAIVMVENLQWHLDQGRSRKEAAVLSVRELAAPLAAATGTTLAAFTPLLLAQGNTADFTRGIPIVVMLALVVSYVYAVFATPVLAASTLRPRPVGGRERLREFGEGAGRLAIARPWSVVMVATVLVVLSSLLAGFLPRDFFPSTDRNQLVVDLRFSEGTELEYTALRANALATDLAARPSVTDVHVFAGSSGPRFYYNLVKIPRSPHLARIVAVSESRHDLPELMHWVRERAGETLPDAHVMASRLGQGPPVDAPIEIQVFAERPDELVATVEEVMRLLRATPGAIDVHNDLGAGLATVAMEIDDAAAARLGLARADVAAALAGATLGSQFSTWRAQREPLPMLIRSHQGRGFPFEALEGLPLALPDGGTVPLGQVVQMRLEWQPAVIRQWDMQRMASVLSETEEGTTYGEVIAALDPQLEKMALPPGVSLVYGGAAAEAGDANSALFQTLPIGLLLLLVFLLYQFNSFRLLGIVLVTVPLAVVGVVPGLLLARQPFSFTAILGVVALVGIVVNNAIVLIDLMRRLERDGMETARAVVIAVGRRTRPILMTTATTVAGLLPLTFTRSTLWPPLAWAIISGLVASTVLTLVVIPALYRLLMQPREASAATP
ncbi:efflux RND transporter permease subunit [Wenzhouxiangella sp. XN24]|uniref:efflux RND transporter permease subunit n=1 Tax=Wenzhouxiangella sp. XN24 TaxID=2713569 RepID=UPI0023F48DB1|nr:efflux RND transporter permease subunit [Wenzhouxiangella sp. XN24]